MIGGKPVANTEAMKNQAETSTSIIDSNKQMVDKLDELSENNTDVFNFIIE
jgi:hypothetical protein